MNRSLLRPAAFVVASALALSLVACGQGSGSVAAPATADPTTEATDDGVETLVELTPPPPTETPSATLEPVTPSVSTPGLVTFVPPLSLPAPEDCVSYDPAALSVVAYGDAWLLRSGDLALQRFDTAADAEDALRVARNWRQVCYIGRGASGPDRYRHIINYFKQPSGLPVGLAPAKIDCITYNPNALDLYEGPAHPLDPDHHYWSLYSGGVPLLELHNHADAARAQLVAAGYTRLCFIGHGNPRPDPWQFQMEWWRA